MLKNMLLATVAVAMMSGAAAAKDLKSIGISLGSLGNPFFIALSKGAEFEARKTNPNVKLLTFGYDYDLGKQVNQINNFIAAGVDLILLNPGDVKALKPAIQKAQAAGIGEDLILHLVFEARISVDDIPARHACLNPQP